MFTEIKLAVLIYNGYDTRLIDIYFIYYRPSAATTYRCFLLLNLFLHKLLSCIGLKQYFLRILFGTSLLMKLVLLEWGAHPRPRQENVGSSLG